MSPGKPDRWWALRRDERLLALDLRCAWEVPALGEVPFVGEVLEKVEDALARWAPGGEAQRASGRVLGPALEDLGAAEGLEGGALAVVNFHLRQAVRRVEEAAALLPGPVQPSVPGPARGWDDRAGDPTNVSSNQPN